MANDLEIVINTNRESLFVSKFSGGRELDSFSESGFTGIDIVNGNEQIFFRDNTYLLIYGNPKNDLILPKSSEITFAESGIKSFFRGDINNFIIPPEESSDEIIRDALGKYKINFPYTSSALLAKKYWQIKSNDDSFSGYLITPIFYSQEDLKRIWDNGEEWEKQISLSFITKIKEKKYKFIMIGVDPHDSVKTQRVLKKTFAEIPGNFLLKLSFGNLFTNDKDFLQKIELENFRNNGYEAMVPSYKDLAHPEPLLAEINSITPFVALNLIHPEQKLLKPYTITEFSGKKFAVTGIVDDFLPRAKGTINKKSKFQLRDLAESIDQTLADLLNSTKIDFVIILNNMVPSSEKNELIRKKITENMLKFPKKQIILVSLSAQDDYSGIAGFSDKNYVYNSPELYLNFNLSRAVHHLKLSLRDDFISEINLKTMNNIKEYSNRIFEDKQLEDELNSGRRKILTEIQEMNVSSTEENLLPDIRDLKNYLEQKKEKINFTVYNSEALAIIISNILLENFSAEIAITKNDYSGGTTIGRISRNFVKDWLKNENDRIVLFNLSGKNILQLNALNNQLKDPEERSLLHFNGFSGEKKVVRARAIKDSEMYRIVTTESLLNNLLLQDSLAASANIEIKEIKLNDFIYDYFVNLLNKYQTSAENSFSADYFQAFSALFTDKSEQLNTLFTLSLPKLQFNYNLNQIDGNEKYTQVKDSRVNSPDSYDLGFNGKMLATLDNKTLKWENSISAVFNQSFIQVKENNNFKSIERKGNDDITAATDFKLRFISINLKEQKLNLIPFLNSSYSTEFKPTINPATNKENNRRSELNNSIGLAFYPLIIDEFRIGLSGRNDFSSDTKGSFNTGWFASFNSRYPLNGYTISLDGNFRYFFPSPEENITQLASYGEVNSSLNIPLWQKLLLNVNLRAFFFQGNGDLRKGPFGFGFNSSLGLSFSFDSKPFYGSFF